MEDADELGGRAGWERERRRERDDAESYESIDALIVLPGKKGSSAASVPMCAADRLPAEAADPFEVDGNADRSSSGLAAAPVLVLLFLLLKLVVREPKGRIAPRSPPLAEDVEFERLAFANFARSAPSRFLSVSVLSVRNCSLAKVVFQLLTGLLFSRSPAFPLRGRSES